MAVTGLSETNENRIVNVINFLESEMLDWLDDSAYYKFFNNLGRIYDSVLLNTTYITDNTASPPAEIIRIIDNLKDLEAGANEIKAQSTTAVNTLLQQATDLDLEATELEAQADIIRPENASEADNLDAQAEDKRLEATAKRDQAESLEDAINVIFDDINDAFEILMQTLDTDVQSTLSNIVSTINSQNFNALIKSFDKWQNVSTDASKVEFLNENMQGANNSILATVSQTIEYNNPNNTIIALYGEQIISKVENSKNAFSSGLDILNTYVDQEDIDNIEFRISSIRSLIEENVIF